MALATSLLGVDASSGCPTQISGALGQVPTVDAAGCITFADPEAVTGDIFAVSGVINGTEIVITMSNGTTVPIDISVLGAQLGGEIINDIFGVPIGYLLPL